MAVLQIPITKAKASIEIDTDLIVEQLPAEVYKEILIQGLKVLLNRGTSKVTKETYPNEDELKAKAMEVANAQFDAVKEGKIKFSSGVKAKKASGAVMTEARRLARQVVKDAMKAAKIKVSHVDAKEITAAANALLNDEEEGPKLVAQATKNLEERAQPPVALEIVKAIHINPAKAAKAEADAAAKKAERQLSATQAGKVAPRAKGKAKGAAQQAQA